ncbi:MAG: 16S rRNA (uracil(1498)-N(3))-methyltransferase [Acutalibacteraceae bacterium]|nr:16S rRNA (uracil(1498)-N(3))-methyltransferase [Acutalibacteraceae bacterium]
MFNFFVEAENSGDRCYYIPNPDRNHIVNVLRMIKGDKFLVSFNGKSDLCVLTEISEESVKAEIIEENYNDTELPVKLYLYQGLPKSDKMELIIQKAVELGAFAVIPTEMRNCVVKLEEKKKKSKIARWQAISEAAAKQSKRNIIPEVRNVTTFKDVMKQAEELDLFIVPYENKNGMKATKDVLSSIKKGMSVGILIGPEGGFDEAEIAEALACGCKTISLGRRILRTETAAITALGMCMLNIEIEEN